MTTICVIGGRGFVGRAVIAALNKEGVKARVTQVHVPPSVRGYTAEDLQRVVAGSDVVVNAAGLAAPDSADIEALTEANATLPRWLAQAAAREGVRRLVHVSTAGVQGATRTLDESATTAAFSPYTRSKAAGEHALQDRSNERPPEVTIYRPTSVFGAERGITITLHGLYKRPIAPIFGRGDQPIPAALVENTGRAIAHLAVAPTAPTIALHPFEGMTQKRLAQALGGDSTRFVHIPVPPRPAARLIAGRTPSRIKPALRRLDLLAYGQEQRATALSELGFDLPDQFENYKSLAAELDGR